MGLLDYSLLLAVETLELGSAAPRDLGRYRYYSTCGRYVYHISIIDYLTTFNFGKRIESFYKTKIKGNDEKLVSAVNPDLYAQRFVDFMRNEVIINEDELAKKELTDASKDNMVYKEWNVIW